MTLPEEAREAHTYAFEGILREAPRLIALAGMRIGWDRADYLDEATEFKVKRTAEQIAKAIRPVGIYAGTGVSYNGVEGEGRSALGMWVTMTYRGLTDMGIFTRFVHHDASRAEGTQHVTWGLSEVTLAAFGRLAAFDMTPEQWSVLNLYNQQNIQRYEPEAS
jgi:hypothetical protein